MSDETYEERARAVKVYKIVRVCEQMLDEVPDLAAAAFRDASPELRARVAEVAGTRVPSDRTWALVVATIEQAIQRREGETNG